MAGKAAKIIVSEKQQVLLKEFSKSRTVGKCVSQRAAIILLGTGSQQKFPARDLYAAILARGIGFEVMDTGAACRLFNVLVGENRRVAAGSPGES